MFPAEYFGATGKHPRWVHLRESDVTPHLDAWLLSVFDPKNLDAAVAALSAAQSPDESAGKYPGISSSHVMGRV